MENDFRNFSFLAGENPVPQARSHTCGAPLMKTGGQMTPGGMQSPTPSICNQHFMQKGLAWEGGKPWKNRAPQGMHD